MICETNLIELDIAKAYTETFMRTRAVPIFNDLDTWKPYAQKEPLLSLNLYMAEPGSFDISLLWRLPAADEGAATHPHGDAS